MFIIAFKIFHIVAIHESSMKITVGVAN